MNMRVAEELTLKRMPQHSEDEEPSSEIILHGMPTGKIISGAFLEAVVRWQDRYLLFITDDVPFEEMLRIVMLDADLNLKDSAIVGNIYSTGSFSILALGEPNRIDFEFIGDVRWSIELLARPGFRVPFIMEPYGVWRRFKFSRHFVVRQTPCFKGA